jgi:hypothetical protein
MRRATSMVGRTLLLAAAIAAPAAGGQAPAASARTGAWPDFATLPEGHVAALPGASPPARIKATEKADGMFGADDACLIDGGDAASLRRTTDDGADAEPGEWPQTCSSILSLQPVFAQGRSRAGRRTPRTAKDAENVHAVRSQRLDVGQDGHATLSMTDAWVDARTHGVRLIGRTTLPLLRVFVGPNGLEVYAARDESVLRVVLRASDRPAPDFALAEQLRLRLRSMAVLLPDGSSGNSDCGLVAFALHAAPGGGEMATLRSIAFLPSLDRDAGGPEGESEEASAQRQLGAMRQRPFALSVSATASTSDVNPVVSVALGWTGRERTGDRTESSSVTIRQF